ncbi:hypothetical protein CGRA01v4_06337 [Colletotrichum graminicola]|nr:hypothetical protein CGRA01v4_06337 [Colletotrichum graminicola]
MHVPTYVNAVPRLPLGLGPPVRATGHGLTPPPTLRPRFATEQPVACSRGLANLPACRDGDGYVACGCATLESSPLPNGVRGSP